MRYLARIAVAATLALSAIALAACGTPGFDRITAGYNAVTSATVAPNTVVVAIDAYDAMEILATNYTRLPRCDGTNGPVCRDPSMRKKIDGAIYSGRSARNSLKAYLRKHPGSAVGITDYDALVAATTAISDATAAYRFAVGK